MKRKVMVIDDEEPIRRILKRFFHRAGFEVSTAEDGRAALERIRKDPPALILLDVHMPSFDGLKFLRALRAFAPGLPVIMVTGEVDEDLARKTFDLGAVDYVVKPLDLAYLETTVQAVLAAAPGPETPPGPPSFPCRHGSGLESFVGSAEIEDRELK